MVIASLEGEVKTFNPLQPYRVPPPWIVIVNANTNKEIYRNIAIGDVDYLQDGIIYVQNLAITAVKVTLNDQGDANKFHFVLGGGTLIDDGGGGGVEIDTKLLGIKSIDLFHETNAIRCAVRKFLR